MRRRALLLLFGTFRNTLATEAHEGGDAIALVQGTVYLGSEQLQILSLAEEKASSISVDNASSQISASTGSLKERASELESAKVKAVEQEDYGLAQELKREIAVLLGESTLDQLKELKQVAVAEEDFDLAKDLKRRIQILENTTLAPESLAGPAKAYYTSVHEPLPWGWRSARDPSSGMEYYWPVNDRSAVTWDRPTAPAAGVAPPPQAKAPPPPPPYQVKSTSGTWSRCDVVGNGTKPGTYNISVRAGSGWTILPDIPGPVIRNATSNETLLSEAEYLQLRKARVLKPKVGDALEVKTKSNSWVPCVVVGFGNETDTYDIHVPFAPVGHQNHTNVAIGVLRQATSFGAKEAENKTAQAENSTDAKKDD